MTVYIDVQHMGDPIKKGRMGAAFGDQIDQTEAYYTSLYAFYMGMSLRERNIEVINISDGTYAERHARVNEYDQRNSGSPTPSVYIACHINAGGGAYSAEFYDSRSTQGSLLASAINEQVATQVKQIKITKTIPSNSSDWTSNAFYCIKGVGRAIAITAEPLFIDNVEHQTLLTVDGMKKLGEAMAVGIYDFITAR